MRKSNILKEKSFAFALRTVKLYQYMVKTQGEFILSKQALRSGTSVGALIRESENASSKKDFIHKLNIALKEADETLYWLELIMKGGYMKKNIFNSLEMDCNELIRILVSSLKTAKTCIS